MSKPPRFFIDPDQVTGDRISVTGEDLRHLRTVLRMREGDALVLLDGRGNEYGVAIRELHRDAVVTEIRERRFREVTGPRITLGQGLPKADKMDWIVQKATELGVSAIVPLVTAHTVMKVRNEAKRTARWKKIAREAAMQSRRIDIPVIEGLQTLDEFLRSGSPAEHVLRLMPWEEGTRPVKDALRAFPGAANVIILIGPEGGFSLSEALAAQDRGFLAVSLGSTILRTETAAVAALCMVAYELRLPSAEQSPRSIPPG